MCVVSFLWKHSAINEFCSCQMGSGQALSSDLRLPCLARCSEKVVLTVNGALVSFSVHVRLFFFFKAHGSGCPVRRKSKAEALWLLLPRLLQKGPPRWLGYIILKFRKPKLSHLPVMERPILAPGGLLPGRIRSTQASIHSLPIPCS